MSAKAAECSSCVPCEKLSRNTLTPASINRRKVAGAREAGPIVATILVRTGGKSLLFSAMAALPWDRSSRVAVKFVEGSSDHLGAGAKLGLLVLAQRQRERIDHAGPAHQARQGDRHVFDAEYVRRRGAHGEDRALVVQHRVHDPGKGAADPVVRG